jgi:hypothetical protein
VQLALLALPLAEGAALSASSWLQPSDISAVGRPNNMGEHVNASEDPRDNILGRRRMRKARQYAPGMSPCLLKQTSGLLDARVAPFGACTNGTTHLVAS